MNFDLEKFLKNYKPAKINLKHFLSTKKLQGYKVLKKNDDLSTNQTRNLRDRVITTTTIIAYIHREDAHLTHNLNKYINIAGELESGGLFSNGIYKKLQDKSKWTHIKIKSFAHIQYERTVNHKKYICEYKNEYFYLKLSNYYIFYKRSKYVRMKSRLEMILAD